MTDRLRRVSRTLGELLVTAGVVLGLFCVYELAVTRHYTDGQQQALGAQLTRTWAASPATSDTHSTTTSPTSPDRPLEGRALARLYLPTLDGPADPLVVVEGVSHDDLKRGPGHYPGTALPGAVGNVVLSGHRTTYAAPFNRLDELKVGDPIVLESRTEWFTYRVTQSRVVAPDAVEQLAPVPGQPGAAAQQPLLTLTTCHPRYSARTRLVVRGLLEAALPKAAGRPPALTGTT